MGKPKTVRILSFDPSTTHLGYSILDYNYITESTVVVKAGTINCQSLLKLKKDMLNVQGKQFTVLMAIEELAEELMWEHQPDYVIAESPFMHAFPQAFAALTLVVFVIRRACHKVFNKEVHMIAPRESKKAISNTGEATKDDVGKAILNNKDIVIKSSNIVEKFTEHAYDAIACGYAFCKIYLFNLLNFSTNM